MSWKTPEPPLTTTMEQVRIRVIPLWGGKPLQAYIKGGWLMTVSGPPSRRCIVEVGPITDADADGSLRRKALRCLERRGYRNIRAGAE